jgi:hypothetical protein
MTGGTSVGSTRAKAAMTLASSVAKLGVIYGDRNIARWRRARRLGCYEG